MERASSVDTLGERGRSAHLGPRFIAEPSMCWRDRPVRFQLRDSERWYGARKSLDLIRQWSYFRPGCRQGLKCPMWSTRRFAPNGDATSSCRPPHSLSTGAHRRGRLSLVNAETTRAKRGGPFAALAVATIVLLISALWVPASVRAQGAGPSDGGSTSPITASELDSLVETLRDDAAREELLLALEALVEAQKARTTDAPVPEIDGIGETTLAFLSRRVEALSSVAADAARFVADLPDLGRRFAAEVSDPEARAGWIEFLVKLILIVGAGFVVERLVIRLLAQPRFELRARDRDPVPAPDGLLRDGQDGTGSRRAHCARPRSKGGARRSAFRRTGLPGRGERCRIDRGASAGSPQGDTGFERAVARQG